MTLENKDNPRNDLRAIADRHEISLGAVEHLLSALAAGNGFQAQFNHPELGGLGQWSQGGMLMIGDMFNHGLKAKVAAVCSDLAAFASRSTDAHPSLGQHQSQYQGSGVHKPAFSSNWWPTELGTPSAIGAQNEMRYAFFPTSRRLALSVGGEVTLYDTQDHLIGGFSQQQSGGQSITFSSQHGQIDLSQLEKVSAGAGAREKAGVAVGEKPAAEFAAPEPTSPITTQSSSDGDIFDKIERLAVLHAKGILSDEQFEAKKSELLARL